jgi:excisionase family DNA binding protein
MEIITIESESFQKLIDKLDQVHQELVKLQDPKKELSKEWIDTYDVCHVLNISRRTLTKYLSEGRLSYAKVDGKNFFKLSDVEKFLLDHFGRHLNKKQKKKYGTK